MLAAAALAGCGEDGDANPRVSGDTLTVYVSSPAHGTSAAEGAAALAGARRALADAGGRAAGKRVRLRALSSTRPGDASWDPGTVEAGAERAAKDATAIAYVGELDRGGSAVSLPVTNRAGLLQISPGDGLTSLTTRPPGRPRAGPERYYPQEQRSFVRLVPSDLDVAQAMLAELPSPPARTAIVHTEGVAERELAGMLSYRLRRSGRPPVLVEPAREGRGERRALLEDLADERPAAILLAAAETAASRSLLAALAARLPSVAVVAAPPLATRRTQGGLPSSAAAVTGVLPAHLQPPRGRRLLRSFGTDRPEALYAYDAMTLALDAIEAGGPDRRRVVAAGLRPRARSGATGDYSIRRTGAVDGRRVAVVDLHSH